MSKLKIFRLAVVLIVILVIVFSAVGKFGYGTICSLGVGQISFTCPLGFLQMCLGSRQLLPQLWLSVGLAVLSIILLGRFFCDWACPTVLLRRSKGELKSNTKPASKKITWSSYSLYAILGGALVSSFLVGFPVFCLVCPIGLFFASIFAVVRLFSIQSASLELLLFPALLGLELYVLKSWCRSICPLGALLGIIGSLNRFLIPRIKRAKCLISQGINCRVCKEACSEDIDLLNTSSSFSLRNCTKCLECYEKCPVKAVGISLFYPIHLKDKLTKNSNEMESI